MILYLNEKLSELSKELLELWDIGHNLIVVDSIPFVDETGKEIPETPSKLWMKKLKNKEVIEKSIYEMSVATSHKKAGFDVKFVKEGNIRTPDMVFIKDKEIIFVECKKKDNKTERDKRNENLWGEMLVNILHCIDRYICIIIQ